MNEYLDQHCRAANSVSTPLLIRTSAIACTMPCPTLAAVHDERNPDRHYRTNAIPLHGNPLRVAEEIAMLDVISGGRIISGFVRGIGCEYFNNGIATGRFAGTLQ